MSFEKVDSFVWGFSETKELASNMGYLTPNPMFITNALWPEELPIQASTFTVEDM